MLLGEQTPYQKMQALWRENDKEIRLEMDQKEKVRDIVMPQQKNRKKLPSQPNTGRRKNLVQIQIPNNRQHKRKQILKLDRQNAVQTLHNRGQRNTTTNQRMHLFSENTEKLWI